MKKLNIDYYAGEFNLEQINGHNLAVAYASGAYSYDNYFFYNFFYAIYRNWNFEPSYDGYIADVLGLNLKQITIKSAEDLVFQIKTSIDNKKPILLQTKLNRLFFSEQYGKTNNNCNQYLLIDGYKEDKPIIRIRQYVQIRDYLKSLTNTNSFYSDTFVDLNIKHEHIIEIWENSKIDGKEAVFVLEKVSEPKFNSYRQLINYYINNISDDKYELLKHNSPEGIRNRFFNSIVMFCNIVKKSFEPKNWRFYNLNFNEIESKLQEFLLNRNLLVRKILKDVLKNNDGIKDEFIEELRISDKYLHDYIRSIYNQLVEINEEEMAVSVNLALNATVTADSEGSNALAAYAVDGKIDDDSDCWRSTHKYETHWLVVDIGVNRTVSKFIIKHHPNNEMLVTKDFLIEGSMDSENWDMLAEIKDNLEHTNELTIPPVDYRYFRLYITNAGSLGVTNARIFSFEIY